jgi:hypothetical protein
MMLEFYNELLSGKGPVFLQLKHLHDKTIEEIEQTLHKVERPTRGLFQKGRGVDYRTESIEMHISEIAARATARPVCSSTNSRGRRFLGCMPPATWRACRTIICLAPSPTVRSPAPTPWNSPTTMTLPISRPPTSPESASA